MMKGSLELGEKPFELDLEKLLPQLPLDLPNSYLEFIKNHNGANGDLPIQPFWCVLWQIDELIENNQDYEIQETLPNYFGIGGNGGGEFIAINLQNKRIYAIPFIVMSEEDSLLITESFEEFEKILGFKEED